MTTATNRWRVVGDEICNPQNEVVPRIVANLPSIQRQETINHIEHAPRRAYERGRADAEQEAQATKETDYQDY